MNRRAKSIPFRGFGASLALALGLRLDSGRALGINSMRFLGMVVLAASLGGCASVTRGTTENLSIFVDALGRTGRHRRIRCPDGLRHALRCNREAQC